MSRRQPVDLRPSESLIAAWAQGRAELFARQQQQAKEAQDLALNEETKARREQQQKQFDAEMKAEAERFKIEQALRQNIQDLAMFQSRYNISKEAESGTPPPGAEKTGEVYEGNDVYNLFSHPLLGEFRARTPETVTRQAVERQKAQDEAKFEFKAREMNLENELEEGSDSRLMMQKAGYDMASQLLDQKFKRRLSEQEYQQDRELAKLEASLGKWDRTSLTADEVDLFNYQKIDPEVAEKLGVPYGTIWGQAFGPVKLNEKANERLNNLNDVEDEIIKFENYLKSVDPKGQSMEQGIRKIFLGGLQGRAADFYTNMTGDRDPYVSGGLEKIGRVLVSAKKASESGAQFTANEQKLVQSYTPGLERRIAPEDVIAMMKTMKSTIRKERLNLITSRGIVRSAPNVAVPSPGTAPVKPAEKAKTEAKKSRYEFITGQ